MTDRFVKIEVTGANEIKAALEGVRGSVQRRILASAMTFAVKPLKPAEAAAVPVKFGTLRRSIGIRVKKYKAAAFAAIGPLTKFKETVSGTNPMMGPRFAQTRVQKPSKYAHMVDKGVKPHWIPAPGYGRKNKSLGNLLLRKFGRQPGWQHPGFSGTNFIEKAASGQRQNVFQRFGQHFKKRIDIEFARALRLNRKWYKTDTSGFGV